MISGARRDELLYESDAALRLVDRAIQEMQVLDGGEAQVSGKREQDMGLGESELSAVAAGDATVDQEPDAVE